MCGFSGDSCLHFLRNEIHEAIGVNVTFASKKNLGNVIEVYLKTKRVQLATEKMLLLKSEVGIQDHHSSVS